MILGLILTTLWTLQTTVPQVPDGRYALVVSGISGEPAYATKFHDVSVTLIDALVTRYGMGQDHVHYLAEKVDRDPKRIKARSTRANLLQTLSQLGDRVSDGDLVFIVFIGHGSVNRGEARFNLPGPDLTAGDLATALQPFTEQTVVIVQATSASGDFLAPLAGPGRIVMTATKTGLERNETTFIYPFVQALADSTAGADVDKDNRVSMLEAFRYATTEVARAYKEEKRLLSEHALLDDDGDGNGTADPALDATEGDGVVARRISLMLRTSAVAQSDTAVARLMGTQASLERQINALRGRKAGMARAEYDRAMEDLLVRLAEVSAEIRRRTGAEK